MTKDMQRTLTIPVFNGQNYELWATRIKTTLKIQGLWEVIDKGIPPKPKPKEDDALEKWKETEMQDMKALQLLQMAVTDLVLMKVVSATTSKEIWEKLQETYQGNEKAKLVRLDSLNKEFEDLKMREGEKIWDYTDKIQEVVNQMSLLGEEKTSHHVIRKILNSMPKTYAGLAALMQETKDLKSITVTDLVGSLISHEAKYFPDDEPIEGAYYARFKGTQFGQRSDQQQRKNKWCNTCKKENHNEEDCYFRKGNSPWCGICKKNNHNEDVCYFKNKEEKPYANKQFQGECFVCGKSGHYAKYCKNKYKDEAQFCQSLEEKDKRLGELSFTATAYDASQIYEEGAWLIDSGATCHMIRDETFFTRLDRTYKVQIRFGCGVVLTSTRKGDISMETTKGNLLSVPQLLSTGHKVLFDENTCTIMDKTWKKLLEVKEEKKNFIIRWEILEEKSRDIKEEKAKPEKTKDTRSESTLQFPVKEVCYTAMEIKEEKTTKDEDEDVSFKREKMENTENESRGSVGIDSVSEQEKGLSRIKENQGKAKEEKNINKQNGNQCTMEIKQNGNQPTKRIEQKGNHEEKANKKNGNYYNRN
ncbi:Retrovirus-related Pol polyprotein from transposon TNT 1-94 [Cardamine amara subsp. amara]|uniref:Retrovirus-related Pol polyprotein from transposon TNT 1-94 n=1 Tax=Cardamine amara subsp. amara TaxID=228776 RepID=A0ABD0YZD8_CARAN